MNTKYEKNIKELVITGYKILTYALLWFTFIFVMSRVNYALTDMTRTFIVTSGSFIVVLLMMQTVYGNFEIGQKKSKPVFLSTMISVLISNFVAALAMIVMGIAQFPLPSVLIKTIPFFVLTYVLQGMVVWFMAHLGNHIYFKLYDPENVLVINKDENLFKKIHTYLDSHDKQYNISKIVTEYDLNKIKNIHKIYALGLDSSEEQELLLYCYKNNITLIYNATQNNFMIAKQHTIVIDDALLIEVMPKIPTFVQLFIKRSMDITGALLLLILSIPVYFVVGIAIKLEDGGPILFTQDRLTKDAKSFKIYKFRSMVVDASNVSASVDDERITRVGHVIRKLRIDELPQAINILVGDISLVGPRPESVTNIEKYRKELPDFDLRLKVKGGLTGYAQIFGKYNTTPEMKLLLDLKYIEDFSIIEDIKLILQTLMVFVRPDSTEGFNSDSDDI